MKKVIAFLLVLTLALGGILFAHVTVTASQDDLLIYPIAQTGDPAVLDGLSAGITFNCGKHLFWRSTYAFGGETETEFVYDRKGVEAEMNTVSNQINFWLTSGLSASTSGSFNLNRGVYGELFQTVIAETPYGGTYTMTLDLSDYADSYALEFSLYYREENRRCDYSIDTMELLENQHWQNGEGFYKSFLELFRFPVQEGQTVTVTAARNDAGNIYSIDLQFTDCPELYSVSYVGSEGIYFLPIFLDENQNPLPYESPYGHGVYFAPWKVTDTYDTTVYVAPDLNKLRLLIPLEETLCIDHIDINGDLDECRILSREGEGYFLTVWDLTTGDVKTRLEVLPHDPDRISRGVFHEDEGYLLITAQEHIALVDPETWQVLLTAPDVAGQRYAATWHTAAVGALRFDGQRLYLLNTGMYYETGAFWAAVWQQDELLYYGEYDCSLMRGNDNWYYNSITADFYPLQWK